jgi:hypothetical protein
VKLYVEGGGDASSSKTACRNGFSEFLKKAGMRGMMPRIVACGSRRDAYDSFCTAVKNGEDAALLVDSEAPVDGRHQTGTSDTWQPWAHLVEQEGESWAKPQTSEDTQCQLMVQCMENWFLADKEVLSSFFGQGFNNHKLPKTPNGAEVIAKQKVHKCLSEATANCKTKDRYGKAKHSFKILALISPDKVTGQSPWALRFVEKLKSRMRAHAKKKFR